MTVSQGLKVARLSLSKRQTDAGPGAELLALCQTVTEDSSLSEAEVGEIREWLADNRASDLPAIGFLTSVVETILRDGKATKIERDELYCALEEVTILLGQTAAWAPRSPSIVQMQVEVQQQMGPPVDLDDSKPKG